jgi:predicted kinase
MLTLIVVQGVPGSGKTTLLRRLKSDLQLPGIGKDDIKEPLYDVLGTGDLVWKEMLGRASIGMLYIVADQVLDLGQSLIIENAFFKQYASEDIKALAAKHNARIMEVYCEVDIARAKQRFIARQESGERHPGHRDDLHATYISDPAFWARYQPLEIGELLVINTETFEDSKYDALLASLKQRLEDI